MKQPTKYELKQELEQLRELANKMRESLRESCTANFGLHKIVQLFTYFNLKQEDKENIIKQFSSVNTVSEINDLYDKIKEKLKNE